MRPSGGIRTPDLAVVSDLHLGTLPCRADALLTYLHSIRPGLLVLCGDIFDITRHRRGYWPESHRRVARRLLKMAASGTPCYYVTGNHDHHLRRFGGLVLGDFVLRNRLDLEIGGRRYLVLHGDQFDQRGRFLAPLLRHLGGLAYDLAVTANRQVNRVGGLFGLRERHFTRHLKHRLPGVRSYVDRFAGRAASYAARLGYDGIICGHIHVPANHHVPTPHGYTLYLNCGDWVEHCSALEFERGFWHLRQFAIPERPSVTRLEDPDPRPVGEAITIS